MKTTALVLVALVTAAGAEVVVPRVDREKETRRLEALGLSVPPGGVVLERPFARPWSPRSLVVPQTWLTALPGRDATVAADDLRRDLPTLAEVMSRVYGGWDSARARGLDWERWFADWGSMLERRRGARLPLAEAFAPVRALMEVQLDNHTTIPLGLRFGSLSRSLLLTEAPRVPCTEARTASGAIVPLQVADPAQRVRRAARWDAAQGRLTPASYLALPAGKGEVTALGCGGRWIPARAIAPLASPAGEPSATRLAPDVIYVRLPTFSKQNHERAAARAASAPRPTGEERVVIVDLRHNDGGDIDFQLLDPWIEGAALEKREVATTRAASCLYPALRWGYTVLSSVDLHPPIGAALRGSLQASLDDLGRPSEPGCPRRFERRRATWSYRQHRATSARRRLLVLVDPGCGSDCELMTYLLASLPGSVIAGSNTAGVMQFIQPGYAVLPYTRLPFRVALGTSDAYGDERSVDGYGLDVDVLLAAAADQTMAGVLGLARHLEDHELPAHD